MELVIAIIGAVGTIAGAVAGALAGGRRGRATERKELEAQAQTSARSLEEQLAARFGLTAASARSEMVVTSTAGDAVVTRTFRGIKVAPGHIVPYITGKFFTATPAGRIVRPVRLLSADGYPRELALRLVESTSSTCKYRIDIGGYLREADPPLDLQVAIEYEKTVLMSEAEVEAAYRNDVFKRDYFCLDVDWPLANLELDITFQAGPAVTVYPAVFFGGTEFEHHAELQRVRAGFERTQRGGRLLVKEPLIGFRYALYWTFPKERADR